VLQHPAIKIRHILRNCEYRGKSSQRGQVDSISIDTTFVTTLKHEQKYTLREGPYLKLEKNPNSEAPGLEAMCIIDNPKRDMSSVIEVETTGMPLSSGIVDF
jgi:hypothetical protein